MMKKYLKILLSILPFSILGIYIAFEILQARGVDFPYYGEALQSGAYTQIWFTLYIWPYLVYLALHTLASNLALKKIQQKMRHYLVYFINALIAFGITLYIGLTAGIDMIR